MPNLQIAAEDLIREMHTLKKIGDGFIDPSTFHVFNQFESDVKGLMASATGTSRRIQLSKPIKTRISKGEYEPTGRSGGLNVYATIEGVWDMKATNIGSTKKTSSNNKHIEFDGIASAEIKIHTEQGNLLITSWKMELGDNNSPGCHFHIGIPNNNPQGTPGGSFPVPRLPNLFFTPGNVIEYVLGELFQARWHQQSSGGSADCQFWNALQKRRIEKLLEWKKSKLVGSLGSPWIQLKMAKPPSNLFL